MENAQNHINNVTHKFLIWFWSAKLIFVLSRNGWFFEWNYRLWITVPLSNMSRNLFAFSLFTSTLVFCTLWDEALSKSSKSSILFEVPPQFKRFLKACISLRTVSSFLAFLTSSENNFSVFLVWKYKIVKYYYKKPFGKIQIYTENKW